MPTVSFPLSYLQRLTPLKPAALVELAFDYGLEATLGGQSLDVEVTAERPDLLAAEGFARALNIYQGQPRSLPSSLTPSGLTLRVDPRVLPLRPYIAALVVRQAHLGDGGLEVLIQFQEKVTQTFGRQRKKIAIGVYDLAQVSGDVTYTALPPKDLWFTPLKGTQPVSAHTILTEHPAGQLYGATFATLETVPYLHDAQGTVLSMPPIINGAGVGEVTAATQNLLIDVTGIQLQTVLDTVNILAHNFLDTGAEVQTVAIATPDGPLTTPQLTRRSVPYSAKYLNEIMGSAIPKHAMGRYLSRMDLHPTGTDQVEVPTYRTDIFSQVDIAGDLLVALGIATLAPDPTAVQFHTGRSDPHKTFVMAVGDVAQRMGLMEVKSFVLTDPDWLTLFQDPADGIQPLQVSNAKSRTLSTPRTTLLVGLLEILSRNIQAPKPINLYETGEVLYRHPGAKTPAAEDEGAAIATLQGRAAVTEAHHWGFASLDDRASFSTAKAYVQTLLKALGIPYDLVGDPPVYYLPGRGAKVVIGGQVAGHFGEIHPHLLQQFSFPEPVCAGELDCGLMQAALAAPGIEVTVTGTSRVKGEGYGGVRVKGEG